MREDAFPPYDSLGYACYTPAHKSEEEAPLRAGLGIEIRIRWLLGVLLVAGVTSGTARGSTFQVVTDLGDFHDEGGVDSVLATDTAGNLYAEATFGGDPPQKVDVPGGGLFEITAQSGFSRNVLRYSFGAAADSPLFPDGGITFSPHNTILGTTNQGGTYGYGTVFNLGTPHKIALSVLHSFSGGQTSPTDGGGATNGLTRGAFGHYYGTTIYGGLNANGLFGSGDGTVFETTLSPDESDYHVIYRFGAIGDGINPTPARLAVDVEGRLYGMTGFGGASGSGTVFMLQKVSSSWQEQVIYSFQAKDDVGLPSGNLVIDTQGNLYGCANAGTHNQGGIFRLSPPAQAGGDWQEAVLYNIGDQRHDPVAASARSAQSPGFGCGITLDSTNNLIVGTSYGGGRYSYGALFTLTPPGSGQTAWTESVAYSFRHNKMIGYHPFSPPLQVGKSYYGGTSNGTSIYAFTP